MCLSNDILYNTDVLIESKEVMELREKIMGTDGRFADVNLRLYFVTEVRFTVCGVYPIP